MEFDDDAILPVELLAQYAYCPRRAYLIRAHGEWADNAFVEEGRGVHRRVTKEAQESESIPTRSIELEAPRFGLRGVVDFLERRDGVVRPVEYKRGKKPPVPEATREPERIQLCAQGLLLRERGYRVTEGLVYYAGSRERVRVRFTPQLEAKTLETLSLLRAALAQPVPPPPLEDSPKCPRCSLVGLCLPEETNFLRRGGTVRPLAVCDPHAFPLVVQEPGSTVAVEGEQLAVRGVSGEKVAFALETVSQVVLMGGANITTPALHRCLERSIPVVFLSGGGWFYGYARGLSHKNSALRRLQYQGVEDPSIRQAINNTLVANKIANCRTILRRNGKPSTWTLQEMARLAALAEKAKSSEELLNYEGQAARLYFQNFATMVKGEASGAFSFENRTRRPPTDPINALLSFLYTLLVKDWTITLETVGFDPFFGFFHAPRHGKPALALDLMEPFRPLVAESVALTVLNTREITVHDFLQREGAYLLKPEARKKVVGAYHRRLEAEVSHPVFGYRVSYRRLFEIHARLLARYLFGEIPHPPEFRVR